MFATNYVNNTPVIETPHWLDVNNVGYLLEAVRREIKAGRRVIVLDLAGTYSIDSTALRTIIQLYKSLRVGEGDLLFINVGSQIARMWQLVRLDRVFSTHNSVAEALGARQQCLMHAS